MPKVSVVIPAYNAGHTLGPTLGSVINQTFEDWEALVVDDGSTDDTADVAVAFKDPRIHVIHQQNRGLAGARNTGIRKARGSLIALLDADDLWHPQKLEKHVAHLDARPEVGVSFSVSEMVDGQGHRLGYCQKPRLRGLDASAILCRNPVGNGSAAVVRKATLRDVVFVDPSLGGRGLREPWFFDERLRQSEDVELWVRIAATTSWKFEGLAEPLTLYRVHAGGLSADVDTQYRTWSRMLDKVATFAPDLVASYGRPARAYQLRYLARRAVRSRDGRRAWTFLADALRADWRIAVWEWQRTSATAAAVLLLRVLPLNLYCRLEKRAMAFA